MVKVLRRTHLEALPVYLVYDAYHVMINGGPGDALLQLPGGQGRALLGQGPARHEDVQDTLHAIAAVPLLHLWRV